MLFSISGALEGGSLLFCIGTRSDESQGDATPGLIDEVRIYEKALSEVDVQRNMTATGLAVEDSTSKLAFVWGKLKVLR